MKNAVFTGFDIFYAVKNTVKVHRVFHRFFHRVKTHRVLHWLVANCFVPQFCPGIDEDEHFPFQPFLINKCHF